MNQECVKQDLSTRNGRRYYTYISQAHTFPVWVLSSVMTVSMMNHTSLVAHIFRVSPPDLPSLYCWALPHKPCVSGALALSCKRNDITFLVSSVLLLNCGTTTPLLPKTTVRAGIEKPARHLDITAVEVIEVHKQTKLYWRILRKIKRKT